MQPVGQYLDRPLLHKHAPDNPSNEFCAPDCDLPHFRAQTLPIFQLPFSHTSGRYRAGIV
jgi:hypothetical protein